MVHEHRVREPQHPPSCPYQGVLAETVLLEDVVIVLVEPAVDLNGQASMDKGDVDEVLPARDPDFVVRLPPQDPVLPKKPVASPPVSYTHLRAHETRHDLVCRLLLEKK